jgi:hypothetical protein
MYGTRVRCPGKVDTLAGYLFDELKVVGQHTCNSEKYEVIGGCPNDGLDPLTCKVRCRDCGFEYYVFPAMSYSSVQKDAS